MGRTAIKHHFDLEKSMRAKVKKAMHSSLRDEKDPVVIKQVAKRFSSPLLVEFLLEHNAIFNDKLINETVDSMKDRGIVRTSFLVSELFSQDAIINEIVGHLAPVKTKLKEQTTIVSS